MWNLFKNLCAKYLVADDPWPFAEYSQNDLLEFYRVTKSVDAAKEIKYRVKAGMIHPLFVGEFFYLWEGE